MASEAAARRTRTNHKKPAAGRPALPSALPHLVAPLLFALAFLPAQRKRILLWSPIVWAPDLDYFFARDYHRAALSNIWIPLILIGVLVWLWRRRDPDARLLEWMWRPGAPANLSIVSYYLLSHTLMDVFAGGVVLLWPLSMTNFYLFFQIVIDTATNQPLAQGEAGTETGVPEVSPAFEWWSAIDTAILVFVVAATGLWLLYHAWHRRHYPPPVEVERHAVLDPIHNR